MYSSYEGWGKSGGGSKQDGLSKGIALRTNLTKLEVLTIL